MEGEARKGMTYSAREILVHNTERSAQTTKFPQSEETCFWYIPLTY